MRRQRGFTLTELIMVIVILSIVATISVQFIRFSTQGAIDVSSRQQVAVAGMNILEPMVRDLRGALPESIRMTGDCIEFLPIAAAGRYQALPKDTNDPGALQTLSGPPEDLTEESYLVINPFADPGNRPQESETVRTADPIVSWSGTEIEIGDEAPFTQDSPARRFFLVTEPEAYCFNENEGLLRRVENYGFGTPSANDGQVAGAGVTEFEVSIDEPSLNRNALVILELTLESLRSGAREEDHKLAREVQIRNVP